LKDVADGLLYYAGEDNRLHLLEAETGRPVNISPSLVGYDALARKNLLINMGPSSVYAINPLTGLHVWEYSPEDDPGFSSELSAYEDLVVFGVRDGTLRALSVRDGAEIWRHDVRDLRWRNQGRSNPPGTPTGAASFFERTCLIRVAHEYVVACSIETGDRIWTWTSNSVRAAAGGSAYLYGDRYYVTGANGSYNVIDAVIGQTVLERHLPDSLPKKLRETWGWLPILVSETNLFVGSHSGHLIAFDRLSGQFAWSFYPEGGGGVTRHLVSKDHRLYYTDFCFRLYCLVEA
jgi:outer membrane protein assembly factor BamB